jgi:hypothetical protein
MICEWDVERLPMKPCRMRMGSCCDGGCESQAF